ncbi:hypothetical protein BEN47_08640 [Hymenobacter lapidarius]|uniref:Carbohydrate-binding protein SusD n=1 Tax=Hymenobacter lapidarius TaxID=1908237 RepID=A0A1G1TD39_9BACT|nr:RagB/SusD family nutrient uptake outer membrane protein [Hymenobacter lapidarius]OGX88797.1 hypothetical protein BEN47_08640 [Hymenobacter lapidarius]
MKNIFSRSATVLTLGLALALTSCDKQLDIDPQQSVDAGTALNSEANVASAVVGLYAQLGNSNLYGTNLILVPELLAAVDTYIRFQGTFGNFRDIANRNTRAENSTAETVWREAYQAINQANLVIDALPVVANPVSKTRFEGEARFVRGTMYFELVRLYGKQYNDKTAATDLGVPISLVPVRTVAEADRKIARSTVAKVYEQVIDDLTKAIALLPTTNGNRATRFTAKAMLARVYLQQATEESYKKAGIQADEVIKTSGKSLAPTLEAVFRGRNGSETLLEIQQNDQNNAGTGNSGLATHYASLGGVGRGDVLVLPAFAAQYGANDARGKDPLLYNSTGARRVSAPNVALRTGKYTTFGQNIPVIRLAEMYLIRAEAAFRAGDLPTALADLNRIRTRSGATPLTLTNLTPANGLATILRERQLELAFEGFRIHDLKRTGTNLVTANGTVIPITLDRLVLPIPKRETDLNDPNNPVLIQNPGY